jgi:hypothetical protein
MAVHQLLIGLGPHEVKKCFKMKLTQPSPAEISVVFFSKAVLGKVQLIICISD